MKTRQWHSKDRTKEKWRPGPWTVEPEKIQWQDETTKLPCLIVRNGMGALCGYVGVDASHPLYRVKYSQEATCLKAILEQRMNRPLPREEMGLGLMKNILFGEGRESIKPTPENAFAVHGCLTFSDGCRVNEDDPSDGICHVPDEGEPHDIWWFGFDCAHAGDYQPGLDYHMTEHLGRSSVIGCMRNEPYRDVAYVQNECKKLAAQLAEVKQG